LGGSLLVTVYDRVLKRTIIDEACDAFVASLI
jgi:hypothetical protein